MAASGNLLQGVAAILRDAPALRRLAPNWSAADKRGHVFLGPPPPGAANAGRAPFIVVDLAELRRGPQAGGDHPEPTTEAALVLRLVARAGRPPLHADDGVEPCTPRCLGAAALADRVVAALEASRDLGDPDHVLDVAIARSAPQRLGPCEAIELKLTVRLIAQPNP